MTSKKTFCLVFLICLTSVLSSGLWHSFYGQLLKVLTPRGSFFNYVDQILTTYLFLVDNGEGISSLLKVTHRLRLTRFQGINFTLLNFCCQHLNLKGKTLLVVVNKLCVLSSVLKQNMFFSSFLGGLVNGSKNSNFFKIAVEESDSIKRNYGGFTFYKEKFAYRWHFPYHPPTYLILST